MMRLVLSIAILVFTIFALLVAAIFLLMEATDKIEALRKHAPWLIRFVERRESLNTLMLLCLIMLTGNAFELVTKELPEVPELPSIKFQPPVLSVMPSTITEVKESQDSLRRRTLRLADKLEAFEKERSYQRMQVSTSRDEAGRAPSLLRFDSETESLYVSRGLKEEANGILQELKAKGLSLGSAEYIPQNGQYAGAELEHLRDLAYRLDANGNLVHF